MPEWRPETIQWKEDKETLRIDLGPEYGPERDKKCEKN
jgi:hypothetical protein